MATPEVLSIEDLVKPISDDNPCGEDLRETGSADYQKLKDARRTISSLTRARKFDAHADPEIDDLWRELFKTAPKILADQSKDLEVAAWLIEAGLRLHGFGGLRDGFRIVHKLVENFWEDIYPRPDEDGLETTVFPITGLNGEDGRGTLILPIKNVALSGDYSEPFTFNLYDRVNEASKIQDPDAQRQRFEDIGMSMVDIEHQVATTDLPFYQTLLDDLRGCVEAFADMSTLLDEKCGLKFAPPSSAIKESLSQVLEAVELLTKDKFPVEVETPEESPEIGNADAPISGGPAMAAGAPRYSGPIGTREDALNLLLLVADYFRKHEPHSPLCGALERVVKWGKMPLQELMMELIPDGNARGIYAQLTGIALGEDAAPIGQLASTAKAAAPAPSPAVEEQPAAEEPKKDEKLFGQEENLSGW